MLCRISIISQFAVKLILTFKVNFPGPNKMAIAYAFKKAGNTFSSLKFLIFGNKALYIFHKSVS